MFEQDAVCTFAGTVEQRQSCQLVQEQKSYQHGPCTISVHSSNCKGKYANLLALVIYNFADLQHSMISPQVLPLLQASGVFTAEPLPQTHRVTCLLVCMHRRHWHLQYL